MTWAEFAGSGAHNWLIALGLVFLVVMTVRAYRMSPFIPETHPDTLGSMDLRERGLDPVHGVLEHEARMNARATSLGYRREPAPEWGERRA